MNINDETFLKAYKCLSGANTLLKNGLGNFSELGKDALGLISKSNVENGERLNKMNDDCVQIFDRMSLTIQLLSQINSKSAEYFNENLTDDDFGNFSSSSSSSSKAQYDSSIIYDEAFIKNLTEQINAALFAVDEDGKYPDYIMDGPNVLPNGQVAYHSIPDTLLLKLAKDGNKFYMNLKGKISSDSKVYVINDGAYSDHGDAFLDNLYKEYYSDVDNGIFIRMSSACGSPDSNSAVVETVCNMFDIPFNNTVIQGFSGGQATVMRVAADVCRKTGKPPAGVALVECHTKPDPWNQEDAKALHDANALVYAVYSNGDGNGSATKKEFTSWGQKYPGVKMVYIDRNRGGHENIYNDYLQSNMLSFFANSSDFPVENFAGSSIEIYNGTWVDYNISGKKNSDVVKELTGNIWEDNYKTDDTVIDESIQKTEDEITENEVDDNIKDDDLESKVDKENSSEEETKEKVESDNYGKNDVATFGDSTKYVLNLDNLLLEYQSGDLTRLCDIYGNKNNAFYDLFNIVSEDGTVTQNGEQYVKSMLQKVQENYTGREAAVNSALLLLKLASDKGVKLDYENRTPPTVSPILGTEVTHDFLINGSNCNVFVSWAVAQGVNEEFGWRSCQTYASDKYFNSIPFENWNMAQPGDILAYHDLNKGAGGHVSMIVSNDNANEKFIVAEASSEKNGVRLSEISYAEAVKQYKVKDLSEFYGDTSYDSGFVIEDTVVTDDLVNDDNTTDKIESDNSNVQSSGKYNGEIFTYAIAHDDGELVYTRADGVKVLESFCDLTDLDKIISDAKTHDGEFIRGGKPVKDFEYWVRDDGAKMLGDFVMVAAYVKSRKGTRGVEDGRGSHLDGIFEYGDIVETTLGPGIIVDFCSQAEADYNRDGTIRYDIYTAWNEYPYSTMVRSPEYVPKNYANDPKHENINNEPGTQKPTETVTPVEPETQKPTEVVPPVEPETQKPAETIPLVESETQKPAETISSVEPETQKPAETIPSVEPEMQKPTETIPSVEPEMQKPTETIPSVEPEIQGSTESDTFESINLNNMDVNNGDNDFDGKKLVLPGILGASLAFLGAKFGKIMKKKRKNDDI